jgi:hypothetical protein
MPNGPLDFWESLSVNELIPWAFVFLDASCCSCIS